MKFIGSRLEILISAVFMMLFQGVFWPPNSFVIDPTVPLDASDPYSRSLSAAVIVFLVIACFARRKELAGLLRPAWPIFVLLALAFVSAFWSEDPYLTLRRATTLGGTTVFGIYLAARFDMEDLVAILVKISFFAAVATVLVVALLPQYAYQGGVDYPTAWRGAYTSKNTLGLMCAFGTIMALYALWNGCGSRLIAAAVIPLNLVLLYLSEAGTPLFVLVASLYMWMIFIAFRHRSGIGLLAGFALIVVALIGVGLIALDWTAVLAAIDRNPTLTGRSRIWAMAIQMIEQRPWLGTGYGAFWRHEGIEANQFWDTLQWLVPHAHNAWLEVGLNQGILGMAAITLVFLDAFYRGLRVLTVPQARHSALILAVFVAILVENQTEYEFYRPNGFLWVFFVACLVYVGRDMLLYRAGHAAVPAAPRPRAVLAPRLPRPTVAPGQ